MKTLFIWILILSHLVGQKAILQDPVSDKASFLDDDARMEINRIARILWDSTSTQIAVITLESIGDRPIELASIDTANALGLGDEELHNGILLFIVKDIQKIRIEVGYGLEGALTDAESSFIIRNVIAADFKNAHYASGILNGVKAIAMEVMDEYQKKRNPEENFNPKESDIVLFVFIVFLASLGIDLLRYRMRNDFDKRRYPNFFPWFTAFGIFFILLRIALHMAASGSYSSSGRNNHSGGFGGGGGGYGGGGGRFGGGGASGGW